MCSVWEYVPVVLIICIIAAVACLAYLVISITREEDNYDDE